MRTWEELIKAAIAQHAGARECYEEAFQKELRRFNELCSSRDRAYEQEMRRG